MKKFISIYVVLLIVLACVVVLNKKTGAPSIENVEIVVQKDLKDNEEISFNQVLKYILPEGLEDFGQYGGITEIIVGTEDETVSFMADYLETNYTSPESFLLGQEFILYQMGFEVNIVSQDTKTKDSKNITTNVYELSNEIDIIYFISSTISFDNQEDYYVGAVATVISQNDLPLVEQLLDSIALTGVNLNTERILADPSSPIKVTVPANWRRLDRYSPYSFYKQDGIDIVYIDTSAYSKSEIDPTEFFDSILISISEDDDSHIAIIQQDTVLDFADKTIRSIVVRHKEDDINDYYYYSIVDFKNSDIFAYTNSLIYIDGDLDSVKEEIESIVNSVELQ